MIRSFRLLAGAIPGALLALLLASPLSGQSLQGLVVEQGENAPVVGAVVRLMDEAFALRASTVTDGDGVFTFPGVTPGRYTLQAQLGDLLSALSDVVAVEADDAVVETVLALPSVLVMLAGQCLEEREANAGILVGIVRDADSDVALPAGRVALRWELEGRAEQIETVTDGGGRYLFCSLPVGMPITANVQVLGRGASQQQFVISSAQLVRQDFHIGLFTGGRARAEVQRGPVRGSASDPGTLIGRLLDAETGQPVSGAVVSLVGTSSQTVTDAQGRFRFDGLTPRSYTIHVQHLGYGRQSEAVQVAGGSDVSLTLRVAPQAIALEGITVRARGGVEEARRRSPTAFRAVAGAQLREMEVRGAMVAEALRDRVPGLTVVEGDFETPDGPSPICVMSGRRNATILMGGSGRRPFCPMVTVYMDDVKMAAPGLLLNRLSVTDFESIQFLSPLEAGYRYGLDAANGVLVLYTRGRGPLADAARN